MKLVRTFPPILILFLLIIGSTQSSPSAIALEQGASARGEGEFLFFTGVRTELFHFAFDVRANKHQVAHGQAQFDNLTADTRVVAKINCMRIDGNEALMTGTVLHSTDPNFPKRTAVIFGATDGQLFQPFRSDTITPLFVSPFTDCHDGASPLTMFEVEDITIDPGSDN